MSLFRTSLIVGSALIAASTACVYAAFKLSPWPSVLLIRYAFDEGARASQNSIAGLVPKDVVAQRGLSYAAGDRDALFDVCAPARTQGALPAVVWIHGGGFISGTRADLSAYLQILAARGFVTVGIDYTVAPEAQFPTPIRQANAALEHIVANAARFHIDPRRIFLAGDSAGAQIAAQSALAISDAGYAARFGITPGIARDSLRGLLLFCGPYDPTILNFEGPYGDFMRTVIWAYLGTRNPTDPRITQLAIPPHITPDYPPVFISVGNADPLAPQSVALAGALRARGVEVDALFFPADHKPPLGHEYQLLLGTEDGRLSFDRATAFLKAHVQ